MEILLPLAARKSQTTAAADLRVTSIALEDDSGCAVGGDLHCC